MSKVLINGRTYNVQDFDSETEFEKAVIENRKFIFGEKTVYIDTKKLIGKKDSYNKGIPDGYLIDFSDCKKPQLYFVENELSAHDIYRHILEQLLRFSAMMKSSPYQIRIKLLDVIKEDPNLMSEINKYLEDTNFSNIDELMNYLVEHKIKIAIVIDEATTDLNDSLDVFKDRPDIATLKKYSNQDSFIYLYDPLREEIEDMENNPANELDTIVCPAFEDGFKHAYIENDAWWAIRISQKMQEQLKYLAIYEKLPVGAIRHYAEITEIKPYKDSGKFILFLKNKKTIDPIRLDNGKVGVAPQSPRYTSINKLLNAKKLSDLW